MRALAIFTLTFLLTAPAAGALFAPASLPPRAIPPLPADITDAEVLTLIALKMGLHPTRAQIPLAPADVDVGALAQRLGDRAGLPVTAEEAAAFRALDPRIAQPVAALMLAMEQAWDMRDAAFAGWSDEDFARAELALETAHAGPPVLSPEQMEMLVNAAILVSDTIESVVIPQLQTAANAGVWPANPVADAAGVLRIGGTGNDVETVDRILQIDARGNDVYRNNAGASSALDRLGTSPVAVSIDLSGNDYYQAKSTAVTAQGAATFGIGALYDAAGADVYESYGDAAGYASAGAAIFRDMAGEDRYSTGNHALGAATAAVSVFREDGGNDRYAAAALSGGFGRLGTPGLLWDRGGADEYASIFGDHALWGYAQAGGMGWFVDETASVDTYPDLWTPGQVHPRACNSCIWEDIYEEGGHGNDDHGGLAYLLGHQEEYDVVS